MGLLSSIGNAVKGAASYVASAVKSIPAKAVAVLDINKAAFTNPVTLVTKGVKAAVAESNKLTPVQATGRIATTTAIAAGTILSVGTTAGKAVASKVITSVIPKSTIGKVAAGAVAFTAAPIIVANVQKSPETADKILNVPQNALDLQKDLYQGAKEPSLEVATQFLKEHPYFSSAAALTGLAALGFGATKALSIYTTWQNTQAMQEGTKELIKEKETQNKTPTPAPIPATPSITPIAAAPAAAPSLNSTVPAAASAPTTPPTPQTQVVRVGGSSTSTKRKKRSSKAVMPSVRQSVNVIVQNRSSSTGIRQSKRYLNKELLIS